jgi:hypothetical protein
LKNKNIFVASSGQALAKIAGNHGGICVHILFLLYMSGSYNPNPFSTYTTLIFNNSYNGGCNLKLFNFQGQIVQYIHNINSDRVEINRNGLPSEFYYYQLSNTNNIIANGKLNII